MTVICREEGKKLFGLIRTLYTKELVKENEKRCVQEAVQIRFLGFLIHSRVNVRDASLKDAQAAAFALIRHRARGWNY